jgi:hypothetical protein
VAQEDRVKIERIGVGYLATTLSGIAANQS